MEMLIAEDDKLSGMLLKKIVEKEGHTAIVASDGLEAWEHVKNKNFNMVITDWMMPKLDGISLCRKIRDAKFSTYIYIILLTAKNQKSDIVKGLEAGTDDYIVKPFNHEELRARIRSGQRVISLEDKYRQSQSQLIQSEKLASIGQLAAGIAHEINTPIQYVGDNILFLQDAFKDIGILFTKYEKLTEVLMQGMTAKEFLKGVKSAIEEADMDYLNEEIPRAIAQTIEGVEHVAKIVRSMKEFAHPGVKEKTAVDINRALENTVAVSRNEWKYVAEIETDLDSSLSLVSCLPGELNQAFLNMIINAAQAIGDVVNDGSEGKGVIRVSTRKDGDYAEIRISDTGPGIPGEIQTRIFDPFFTTKEVGKGTGQGLAISRSVIVEKHGGNLSFSTETGKGTVFIIRLPLKNKS